MIAVFDTCIVLDYLLGRSPFADDAETLILQVAEGRIDGLITVKSLMDIHYVLKHSLHNEKKTRQVSQTSKINTQKSEKQLVWSIGS